MSDEPDGDLRALVGNPLLDEHRLAGPVGRRHPVRQRLVRRCAYGIPNDDALDVIAAVSPAGVVELGAGTGFWARLLHDRGVDMVAYDRWPPGTAPDLCLGLLARSRGSSERAMKLRQPVGVRRVLDRDDVRHQRVDCAADDHAQEGARHEPEETGDDQRCRFDIRRSVVQFGAWTRAPRPLLGGTS